MQTLNELFRHTLKNHPNTMEFYDKDKEKKFQSTKFKDAFKMAQHLGYALIDLGLEEKENVGHFADNRLEWWIADMAVQLNGAVDVPRGTDSTPKEIEYILNHSEAKITFIENKANYENLKSTLAKTKIKKVIILNKEDKINDDNVYNLYDLIEKGKSLEEKYARELERREKAVTKDDLFTMIYTSGTTGNPKGVMLTHQNMIYNTEVVPPMVGLQAGDRTLSILPVWHVFERAVDYAIVRMGAKMYFTNIRDLRDDFQKCKPTFMVSAPRLWENIYQGIKNQIEKAEGMKKVLFNNAYELKKYFKRSVDYLQGNRLQSEEEAPAAKLINGTISFFTAANLFAPALLSDAVVFKKLKAALGGNLRGTISGGGALPAHVDEFFNAIGIPIYEGYGMTETAPIIAVRSVGHVIQGSVGYLPPKTEVRILNDKGEEVPKGKIGVVHVKGPQVMKGYYKNEEETSKALKDGWLNTGDLGFISFNNTLSIRGRAKETIVLVGGENVEPVPIENLLLESDFINQIIVVGQDRKTLGALIWPDIEKLKAAGFSISENEDLNKNEAVRKEIQKVIKSIVTTDNGFKAFEKVTGFQFLPKPMEVGDELTNLFKMKRNVIANKYADLIEKIYL